MKNRMEIYVEENLNPFTIEEIENTDGMEVLPRRKPRRVARIKDGNVLYITTFGKTIKTKYYAITNIYFVGA